MTKFNESIAKLAWLSPYTHSCLGWKETKTRTILQILPLIGTYYIFKKDENGNIFLETILNELNEVQLPNNFFERIEKEEILLVVEKHQEAFENSLSSDKYTYVSEELKSNNKHVGKVIWKGFQEDLSKPTLNETILNPISQKDILISFELLTLEYLKNWTLQLSKEDREAFIEVFDNILISLKDFERQTHKIYSFNLWHLLGLTFQRKAKEFFIDFFKKLIECLKKE